MQYYYKVVYNYLLFILTIMLSCSYSYIKLPGNLSSDIRSFVVSYYREMFNNIKTLSAAYQPINNKFEGTQANLLNVIVSSQKCLSFYFLNCCFLVSCMKPPRCSVCSVCFTSCSPTVMLS